MIRTELLRVELKAHHSATGATRHWVNGELAPEPKVLKIVQFEREPGYYLLYCDGDGREVTDTWHQNLSDAIDQAEFEFNVREAEWVRD